MRTCILNVADGDFLPAQRRLKRSLERIGYRGDLLFWSNDLPPGSPDQDTSPMAFKPFAFRHAFEKGYDVALWLDAAMIAIRSLEPLLKRTARSGVYLWGAGAICGEWASDDILGRFDVDREESLGVEEVVSCVVGVAAGHPAGRQFLGDWIEKACDGASFRGVPRPHPWTASRVNTDGVVSADPRVKGHRWDQTAASLIAYRHGLRISHLDCLDVIHYGKGSWTYVEAYPLTVRLLQNRDFKAGSLRELSRWGGRRGLTLLGHLLRCTLKTVRYTARSLVIRSRFRRPNAVPVRS